MSALARVLLVNPHETEQLGYTNPPLGLLYIAGTLLPAGIDTRVMDGCFEGKEAIRRTIEEFRPDIVGVTCLTPGRKKALEVAEMAKKSDPRTLVVLGGAHATIMNRQILENYPAVDAAVLGEGEQTTLEIARGKDLAGIDGIAFRGADGSVVRTRPRAHVQNLDDIPFPAWHLVDLKRYPPRSDGRVRNVNGVDVEREPRISVVFSRGCMGHCSFCSTWWIWKGWRHRSGKNMADELELLYRNHGIRSFCFADDAMTGDRQAVIDLCDEIVSRGLKIAFTVTTRTDCVDEELLRKLKEAGCYIINYGIESGSPKILEAMGKENDVATAGRAIRLAKEAGISVTALMITGNVGETEETVEETVRFLKRAKPDNIGSVGGLWILPGTRLYQKCRRAGFIDDSFWLSDEPYKVYTLEHSFEEIDRLHRKIAACERQTPWRTAIEVLKHKPLTLPRRVANFLRHRILKSGAPTGDGS